MLTEVTMEAHLIDLLETEMKLLPLKEEKMVIEVMRIMALLTRDQVFLTEEAMVIITNLKE